MKSISWARFIGIFIPMGMMLCLGCSRAGTDQPLVYDPAIAPLTIYVCRSASKQADPTEESLLEGIRVAHQVRGVAGSRKIDLVLKDPGENPCNTLETVSDYVRKEHIDGPILFPSSKAHVSAGDISADSGAFVSMVPFPRFLQEKRVGKAYGDYIVQIGTSLKDQARAAAFFAHETLKQPDALVILAQDAPGCIMLASLFSAEFIRLGGSIRDIVCVPGNRGDLKGSLASLENRISGVVYIPFAQDIVLTAVDLVRSHDRNIPVIISNAPREKNFLEQGSGSMEGVYFISDFYLRKTRSQRVAEFLGLASGEMLDAESQGSVKALGMDAYFVLLDYLMHTDAMEKSTEDGRSMLWRGIPENITGSDHWNRLHTSLHVYHVQKDLFTGLYLDYFESIKL